MLQERHCEDLLTQGLGSMHMYELSWCVRLRYCAFTRTRLQAPKRRSTCTAGEITQYPFLGFRFHGPLAYLCGAEGTCSYQLWSASQIYIYVYMGANIPPMSWR